MAKYEELKYAVAQVIKNNGNEEITGDVLQNTLLAIINSVGEHSGFAGIAKPTDNPGMPDQNLFYIATEPGTYVNFNFAVVEDEALILEWRGEWIAHKAGFASMTAINAAIQGKLDKATFDDLFEKVNIGTTSGPKYAIRAKYSFYTDGFLSAMGLNPDAGGGTTGATALSELTDVSLSGLASGQLLMYNGSKWVNIDQSQITPDLSGYATQSWVQQQGYATTSALNGKVDKIEGYGLSKNDFTDALLEKLNGIEEGANKYTHPTNGAEVTIGAEAGRVLSAITVDKLGHVTSVSQKTLAAGDIPMLSIAKISGLQDALNNKLDAEKFNDMFEKVETDDGYAIHAKYGFYADIFMSVKGQNPDAGGGVAGATALAELTDVSLSALANGQLLMYNGSKWTNVAQSSIVPTLKNLTFGSKTYNGTTAQTITAADLGALTSHQPIYALSLQAGAFSAKTYTPNVGTQTINIPTKVSHLSNDSGFITSAALSDYVKTKEGQNVDANVITKTGIYGIASGGSANTPSAYGTLLNFYPYYGFQMFAHQYGAELYFRGYDASHVSFTNWKKVIHSENYSSYINKLYIDGLGIAAASAEKLQTAHTLWGRSFDGTGNVSGNMRDVGNLTMSGLLTVSGKAFFNISDATLKIYQATGKYQDETLCLQSSFNGGDGEIDSRPPTYPERTVLSLQPLGGYVAIGKTTANYALDVTGAVHATTGLFTEGYISGKGQNTASDARLKTYMEDVTLSVADVANAPAWRYKWKSDGSIDVGSTTQYWGGLIPELTHKLPDGEHYGLDYGKTALLSVIAVARTVQSHEERIAELERENKQLKQTLKKYIS